MEHPVKTLREALGLTQAAFGDSIGVTGGRVSHIEKGIGSFKTETWLLIAEKYRIQIARLGFTLEGLMQASVVGEGNRRTG